MLPYLELDPQTALVQTPQHFFNVDHTGDVFNHQNATFFFGCQTGLDSWRATVCCGTNFAVRAAPLAAIGWFPTESITEDFLLSLKLTASGWHCRYHGHVLTTGEAPTSHMLRVTSYKLEMIVLTTGEAAGQFVLICNF